jgi:hypothetical protein
MRKLCKLFNRLLIAIGILPVPKHKLEIIEETWRYYASDPKNRRAKNGEGKCRYYTAGRMCGVGRCMVNPEAVPQGWNPKSLSNPRTKRMDRWLKPEYRGHDYEFWCAIQALHDTDSFWDEDGLTAKGKNYVANLNWMYSQENIPIFKSTVKTAEAI